MGVYIPKFVELFDTQGPAPDGFHVPLTTEWQSVSNIWYALGKSVYDAANFGIALKLPFAGARKDDDASVVSVGSSGIYWSSSRYDAYNAYGINVSNDIRPQFNNGCSYGFSVRCFKDTPVVPTSSWTKLVSGLSSEGGIFRSSSLGLISMSSDGVSWITMADKNLGATTVWNSGDTLTDANCGYFYQRGNNYGFPHSGTVTTSSTKVNASNYGPGDYYSSSTFITGYYWDSSNNTNLRGGTSQGTYEKVTHQELKNAYIGEYGWQPGANTIAYLKLEKDTVDSSGKGNNGTATNISYITLDTGKNVASFGGNAKINFDSPLITGGDCTFSVRLYCNDTSSNWLTIFSNIGGWGSSGIQADRSGNGSLNSYVGGLRTKLDNVYLANQWFLYTLIIKNGTLYIYKNTTLIGTVSGINMGYSSNAYIGYRAYGNDRYRKGYMSDFICEDKGRSEQELTDYFNLVKGDYGIS